MTITYDQNRITQYEETLRSLAKKIKTHHENSGPAPSSEEIASATATLHEYYDYLAQSGVAYGLAAQDVAKNERPFGQFANRYFEHQAQKEGKTAEQLPEIKDQLRILLAYGDAAMRSKTKFKIEEQYRGIKNYHLNSLDVFKLSPKAWGGTFFEEYMGEGSYMDLGGYDVRVDVKQLQFLKAAATNQKAHGVGFWEYSKTLQEVGFDMPTMTTTASLMRMAISEGPKGTLFVRGTSEEQVADLLRVPVSSVVENAVGGDTINRSPMKIFTVFHDAEQSDFSLASPDHLPPLHGIGMYYVEPKKVHTVGAGDTVWKVAKDYGLSVNDLLRIPENGHLFERMTKDKEGRTHIKILPGETIHIPESKSYTPSMWHQESHYGSPIRTSTGSYDFTSQFSQGSFKSPYLFARDVAQPFHASNIKKV